VHYPLEDGLNMCVEMEGWGQCAGSPADNFNWSPVPGAGDGWTFEEESGDWTTRIWAGSLASYNTGTYVVHFYDGGSGFQSDYAIQLVE